MVSIKIQFLLLALATFVMACLLSSHQAAAELDNDVKALTRIICCGDLIKLYRRCKEYVKKDGEEEDLKEDGEEEDPSEECCSEVQKADLPCICQYLPPIVERFIDMEKLANVAEKCERPLPSGTKCGSYTVPTFQLAKKKLPPPPPPKIQEERKVYPPPPPPPPPKLQEERKSTQNALELTFCKVFYSPYLSSEVIYRKASTTTARGGARAAWAAAAMGSGVTENQPSSSILIPASYREKSRYRPRQYLAVAGFLSALGFRLRLRLFGRGSRGSPAPAPAPTIVKGLVNNGINCNSGP
ncbi:hypothetical protein ACMD2_00963 [Ananas comosus]|uniref:Bifunctional inhibitor/plant lipid transfer protein/seed storage helical domain-containing protein n=1 Tax=Ananas comosus TaxID=4615 RepID=A0A199UXB3_ANACO|nr:hypothetical protein ACMD2_00963 [Ananas comosus]